MIALLLLAATAACANPQTQSQMTMCAAQDFTAADLALNKQWAATVADAKQRDSFIDRRTDKRPGSYATLLVAQRAWLAYRDAHCTGESYDARGGSMEPMLFNACRAELTRARTKQLAALMDTH